MAYRGKIQHDQYHKLMQELQAGQIRPVYIFYGDESFLLENSWLRLQKLCLDETTSDIDSSMHRLDGNGKQLDLKTLSMDLRTPPFFSEKRLILVQRSNFFSAKANLSDEDFKVFTDMINEIPDSACLVFWEEKYDSRLKRFDQLIEAKDGLIVQFVKQEADTLISWVRAWLAREALEIETLACESLIDRCEQDMRSLTQELSKLKHYCLYAGRKRIDHSLVNLVCRPDRRGSIFDLTDAISAGNTTEALRLLHLLWSNKEPSQLILTMLARHFKQLLCAQEWTRQELAKGLSVQPFVARRLKEQSVHFSVPMLEALYEAAFQTDLGIKTGQLDADVGLEILLAQAGRAARILKRQRK